MWCPKWQCVSREEDPPRSGGYAVVEVGKQSIIVTRANCVEPEAFPYTCRQSGSLLCKKARRVSGFHGRWGIQLA